MARYKFDPEGFYKDGRAVWILDLTGSNGGCEVKSGDIFDPADYGFPDWKPEPYPHPMFKELGVAAPASQSKPAAADSGGK